MKTPGRIVKTPGRIDATPGRIGEVDPSRADVLDSEAGMPPIHRPAERRGW
jgi:hypothetical protein